MRSLARWGCGAALVAAILVVQDHAAAQAPAGSAPPPTAEDFGAPPAPPPSAPPPAPAPPPPAPAAAPAPPPAAPAPAPAPAPMVEHWYGWQTLIADGVAVGLVLAAGASETPSLNGFAYGTFLLAPPIVHFSHGHVGKGFGDFALRLFLPPLGLGVGGIAGLVIGGSGGDNAQDKFLGAAGGLATGLEVGFYTGAALASLIDVLALGYETVRADEVARARRAPAQALSWTPTLSLGQGRGFAGVAGRF